MTSGEKAANLDKVQKFLEMKMVRERLKDLGFTPEEIQGKLNELNDQQLHQLAMKMDDLKVGGDGLGVVIVNLVIIILVIVIIQLSGHRIVVHRIRRGALARSRKGFFLLRRLKGRFPKAERPFFFVPILIFLGACAAVSPLKDSGPQKLVAEVPFFPQEMYQCGPASLAGVLNYWGILVTPEEIAQAIYSPSARGTLDLDLVFYAEKRGLKAFLYPGSGDNLKKNIEDKIPLIVLVDEGFLVYQKYHFMIVVGYNDQGIFAHSGKERQRFYPWPVFLKTWEKTKNWTLRLTPG